MTTAKNVDCKNVRDSTGNHKERPLSPHLQIYRLLLTMIMSIMHRVSGAASYAGMTLFVFWLLAAAADPGYFDLINGFMSSLPGLIILFLFTWTLILHLLGGLRHLIWDTGYGLGKTTREGMALATAILAPTLTLLIWVIAI